MDDIKNSEDCMKKTQIGSPSENICKNNAGKIFRPLVYICSPYHEDVEKTRRFCRFALDKGQIPLAPDLLFPQFMEMSKEQEAAMFFSIILMGKCQEVWVLGEKITSEMSVAIEKAQRRRQKIRYFNSSFEEVK